MPRATRSRTSRISVAQPLADTLTGDTAANVIDGGAGADAMTGGTGNDTYVVDDAGDVITEALDRRH